MNLKAEYTVQWKDGGVWLEVYKGESYVLAINAFVDFTNRGHTTRLDFRTVSA